jgi:hypothetical protein
MPPTRFSDAAMRWLRLDRSQRHPGPTPASLIVGVSVAVAGTLAADWLLVTLWTRLVPGTKGYGHLRFSDYAALTVIGVLVAAAAWAVVCRLSATPRWLFLRLAVPVTVVLWIPDVYLLLRRQPGRDVAVLMVLHVVVAVVAYNALVRLAPPRSHGGGRSGRAWRDPTSDTAAEVAGHSVDRWAALLAVLVGVEFVLGVATLVLVPTGRPTGWWPDKGRAVYLAHTLVGLPLGVLAILFVVRAGRSTRLHRLSGWIGGAGVALAGLGGLLAVAHPLRLVGVALMLAGPVTAGFGYLIPTFDRLSDGGATDGQNSPTT